MTRFALFLAFFILSMYFFRWIMQSRLPSVPGENPLPKMKKRKKVKPGELWTQVFETASREEARSIQMRLEEQDIAVTIFEQAKKSLDGDVPPGYGIVVPRDQSAYAQQLIFRYLEHTDRGEQPKA